MKAAIDKLQNEITNNNNPYVHVVGQFLIQHVSSNHSAAAQILAEGKTILGSLEEMRKEAEKVKVGNCAVLTDQQGFEIVLQYFGIETGTLTVNQVKAKTRRVAKSSNVVPLKGDGIQTNLFDFIEEG